MEDGGFVEGKGSGEGGGVAAGFVDGEGAGGGVVGVGDAAARVVKDVGVGHCGVEGWWAGGARMKGFCAQDVGA